MSTARVTPEIALELNDLLQGVDLPAGMFPALCDLVARLVTEAEERPPSAMVTEVRRRLAHLASPGGDRAIRLAPDGVDVTHVVAIPLAVTADDDDVAFVDLSAEGQVIAVERHSGPLDVPTLLTVLRHLPDCYPLRGSRA